MTVKICGITSVADALLAADAGADFIGLIRAASPRSVEISEARRIFAAVRERNAAAAMRGRKTEPVLLFRDAPVATVVDEICATGAACVQLHGGEPAEYVEELKARSAAARAGEARLSVIKAWEVAGAPSVENSTALRALGNAVDIVIADVPKGAGHPQLEALRAFAADWEAKLPPLWCAGGLTPENVAAAIRGTCFAGVDVARGVEAAPGRKDPAKVHAFIAAARTA